MPDGYAMLMRPNKAEPAVHGCHCQSDMALRMRKVLAKPWVGVRVCHFLLLMSLLTYRPVHALRGIMGNQGKFTKKQSRKTNVFLYIPVPISHLVTKRIQQAEKPLFCIY